MDLKYGQSKMVTTVKRPTVISYPGEEEEFDKNIAELTTWVEENTELVLGAAQVGHIVQPGDKITITIEIAKEAPDGSNGNWS